MIAPVATTAHPTAPHGKLSTHVLDAANGCPAAGMRVDLYEVKDGLQLVKSFPTNAEGRNGDGPVLGPDDIRVGKFQLHFHVGDYFKSLKAGEEAPAAVTFLDVVPVAFGITNASQGYHVPLLCSRFSYSTYRGTP